MNKKTPTYLHLPPDSPLPALALPPFQAIVLLEDEVDEYWMFDAARWLVASGCRYALAWGRDCEAWREAVEDAALEAADYEDAPPERGVLATAHEDEELEDVFWFAKHRAAHPGKLDTVLILHVGARADRDRLVDAYTEA